MLYKKKIFITGGAGFLGKALIKHYYQDNDITIFSRDENKHYFIKQRYPKVQCIIGDIRHRDLLVRAARGHDIGIFAGSLKQIEACEQNYEEAIDIIINGAVNSKYAAIKNNMEAACFISTDKSRAATTLYGAMKYVAGESFIEPNTSSPTRLSCAIYGNVMNSTGSIIPIIWDCIDQNRILNIYHPMMTRFMLEIGDAIDLIEKSLAYTHVNIIPALSAFSVLDLANIYRKEFGLQYTVTQPRPNEKIHEVMIVEGEHERCDYYPPSHIYIMGKTPTKTPAQLPNNQYCSRDYVISETDLYQHLESHSFYKQCYA